METWLEAIPRSAVGRTDEPGAARDVLLALYFPTAGKMFGEVLEHSKRTLSTAGCRLQQAGERAGAREGAHPIKTQHLPQFFPA